MKPTVEVSANDRLPAPPTLRTGLMVMEGHQTEMTTFHSLGIPQRARAARVRCVLTANPGLPAPCCGLIGVSARQFVRMGLWLSASQRCVKPFANRLTGEGCRITSTLALTSDPATDAISSLQMSLYSF